MMQSAPSPTTAGANSPKVNPEAVAANTKALNFARTTSACLAGAVAGVLGLTGLVNGLLFYVASYILLCVFQLLRIQFRPHDYFQTDYWVFINGVGDGILSFIFFWTLFYDIVYIY